ncbi:pyridoxal phosphate-dependent aminotransferase [Sphingomonas oryzagri]|uniref:Aminotransferase n=1 Tax=Sphingomonas oryzagri TaxID=3042314 RepID=A0ABT6N4R3_9SPHN|nr:pyridoxal phosphate-dependent aminotransferase [Sphingomonas oryzagri]MDH7640009.1 pyridoxal phosphate-dependent aminotransferase [Sphingomonas oryzagri]
MRPLATELPGSLIRTIANAAMGREDVIPLWFGESDLPTPRAVVEAANASLSAGDTFYGPNLGIAPLRDALTGYLARIHGADLSVDQIAVTSSGLNAILLVLSAIVDPGDEVVVVTPTWPNLIAVPRVLGAVVREVPLRLDGARFVLDLDAIVGALGPRTRAVILNSPHNPTGWRMPAADMARLVDELGRRGVWLIADEVYARILRPGADTRSFLSHFDDAGRVIVVNSFSKTWAMTGWRLGWVVAPRAFVAALERLIEFNTSCAPGFVQRGGIAALGPEGDAFVAMQAERLEAARAAAVAVLAKDPRILVPETEATFYLFPRVDGLADGEALAWRAIEHGVGIAPGEAFGDVGRGHIRLCFARDPAAIRTAADRLLAALR